jgi:hypothetical protein
LALRELHASHIGEKAEAIGEIPACRCCAARRMTLAAGADPRPRSLPDMEK